MAEAGSTGETTAAEAKGSDEATVLVSAAFTASKADAMEVSVATGAAALLVGVGPTGISPADSGDNETSALKSTFDSGTADGNSVGVGASGAILIVWSAAGITLAV